jgi:hypothetical protein
MLDDAQILYALRSRRVCGALALRSRILLEMAKQLKARPNFFFR